MSDSLASKTRDPQISSHQLHFYNTPSYNTPTYFTPHQNSYVVFA